MTKFNQITEVVLQQFNNLYDNAVIRVSVSKPDPLAVVSQPIVQFVPVVQFVPIEKSNHDSSDEFVFDLNIIEFGSQKYNVNGYLQNPIEKSSAISVYLPEIIKLEHIFICFLLYAIGRMDVYVHLSKLESNKYLTKLMKNLHLEIVKKKIELLDNDIRISSNRFISYPKDLFEDEFVLKNLPKVLQKLRESGFDV